MNVEEFKVIRQKIAEERSIFVDDLATGRADTHAGYMHSCGVIKGFDIIDGLIADLQKNIERDDDE